MKRIIAIVCLLALMLGLAAYAYAASSEQSAKDAAPNESMVPAGAPAEGSKPSRSAGMLDLDAMVSNGVISQETCDKIKAYMEERRPAGRPDQNIELPQMDGQASNMDGQAPNMDRQMPQMDGQPPQMDGQAPQMGGQPPQMDGQAPSEDESSGISKLPSMNGERPELSGDKPAMTGERPELSGDKPELNGQLPQMDGQAPQMNGQPPQMNGQPSGGLLDELLSSGIITQSEYDALSEALAE
ncbi:MAG: hypothetical protein II971_08270 [Firmicutes bacterium]|nr:hypothetical protein [Bacillota bacterium]